LKIARQLIVLSHVCSLQNVDAIARTKNTEVRIKWSQLDSNPAAAKVLASGECHAFPHGAEEVQGTQGVNYLALDAESLQLLLWWRVEYLILFTLHAGTVCFLIHVDARGHHIQDHERGDCRCRLYAAANNSD
jgi:hypothetical protein